MQLDEDHALLEPPRHWLESGQEWRAVAEVLLQPNVPFDRRQHFAAQDAAGFFVFPRARLNCDSQEAYDEYCKISVTAAACHDRFEKQKLAASKGGS